MARLVYFYKHHEAVAAPPTVTPDEPVVVNAALTAAAVFPPRMVPRRFAALGTDAAWPVGLDEFPPPPAAPDITYVVYPDRLVRRRALSTGEYQAIAWTAPPTEAIEAFLPLAAQAVYPARLSRPRGLSTNEYQVIAWQSDTPAPPVFEPLAVAPVFPDQMARRIFTPISQQQAVWTAPQAGSEVVLPTSTFTIRRLRRAPYVTGIDRGWVFYETFLLDMEVGTGSLTSAPVAALRWSDDRGNTWTDPIEVSFGLQGEYRTRVRWTRLGKGRDRIFEVSFADPVKVDLVDAFLELKRGAR